MTTYTYYPILDNLNEYDDNQIYIRVYSCDMCTNYCFYSANWNADIENLYTEIDGLYFDINDACDYFEKDSLTDNEILEYANEIYCSYCMQD